MLNFLTSEEDFHNTDRKVRDMISFQNIQNIFTIEKSIQVVFNYLAIFQLRFALQLCFSFASQSYLEPDHF